MPPAVTHVLLTIILVDLFRDYIIKDKTIPLHFLFIGGVAGLLPDIDIPFFWFLNDILKIKTIWFHGTITHTIWVPLLLLIASVIAYKFNRNTSILLGIITFGLFFHIFLDFTLLGNIMPFYPLSNFTIIGIMANSPLTHWDLGLDAVILLGWLWHEERKYRISDFI